MLTLFGVRADLNVCRHFQVTVHQTFTSVLLLAPVIRNRQNWALEGGKEGK